MAMLFPISGSYNFAALSSPTLAVLNECILQVTTSSAASTITLPDIDTLGGQLSFMLKIADVSGNASVNNITINTAAGDTFIGGATQFIMNGNYSVIEIILVGTNSWAIINSSSQSSSIYSGHLVMTSAQVLANNVTAFKLVTGIPNKIIQLTSFVAQLDFNSIAYSIAALSSINFHYGSTDSGGVALSEEFLEGTQDKVSDASLAAIQALTAQLNLSTYKGADVNLLALSAVTLGNSPITLDFEYRILAAV